MSDDIAARLKRQLGDSPLNEIRKDLKHNVKTLGAALLGKMGAVNRDDFDKQNELLAETSAQLESLRKQLEALQSAPPPAKTKAAKSDKADKEKRAAPAKKPEH